MAKGKKTATPRRKSGSGKELRQSTEKSVGALLKQFRRNPASLTPRELLTLRALAKTSRLAAAAVGGYEAHKERARRRQAKLSASGRDIGEIPEIADQARWQACRSELRQFCETYLPETFFWPWSPDHLKIIAKLQRAVLAGGLFAMAMPRGSGKTVLCEAACLWALLYGHRRYVAIIGPNKDHAVERVTNQRITLETNELLLADFPAVFLPIRRLEGIYQRRLLYHGEPIRMVFTAKRIILPAYRGIAPAGGDKRFLANGAIMGAMGITGQIRGLVLKRADGTSLRPSMALLDDPQTDESANIPAQCAQRERLINGAVLGLAGPGTKICAVMPCTVVRPDDLADRILDTDKHPQWNGERTKMVYQWPTAVKLWERYAELWREGHRSGRDISLATEFYRANRGEMDAGAVVAWPQRHNPDELSAIQAAYNILLDRGEEAFHAEYQNDPLPLDPTAALRPSADQIAHKLSGYQRGLVPLEASYLTMFIDVQKHALWWIVAAWTDQFTGYVIDYGTEPEQERAYFTEREIRRTMQAASPGKGWEAALYAALERLIERTVGREWKRDGNTVTRIDRCLIDANWAESTDVVYHFSRVSRYAHVVMPSHGKGIGAGSMPMANWQRKPGDRVGLNWRIPLVIGKRAVRHVIYDTNFWKSFIQTRIETGIGDPGCLALFGRDPERHRMLADHWLAERPEQTAGRGRTLNEWRILPSRDNHLWDGIVGCAVAASIMGAGLEAHERPAAARKSYAAKYAEWRSQRHV